MGYSDLTFELQDTTPEGHLPTNSLLNYNTILLRPYRTLPPYYARVLSPFTTSLLSRKDL
ncbi:MAG: hypothetical protein AB4057_15605 [Crocosphaera sp.]